MNTHRLTHVVALAALAASLVSSVGCSAGAGSASTPAPGEKTGTSAAAVTESQSTAAAGGFFNRGALTLALSKVDFFDSTISFSTTPCPPCTPSLFNVCPVVCPGILQPLLTFNASPALVQQFPGLATNPPTLQLPVVSGDGGSAYVTSFALPISQVTLLMNDDDLEITAPFSGSIHVTTGNILDAYGDVTIDAATLDVHLQWSGSAQAFQVTSVTTDLQDHVSNCGLLGCDLIASHLTDLDTQMSTAVQNALGPILNGPTIAPGLYGFMATVWNQLSPPPAGSTPWTLMPGTLAYLPGEFIFTVTDSVTPAPSCGAYADCTGDMYIECPQVAAPLTQYIPGQSAAPVVALGNNVYTVTPGAYTICNGDGSAQVCQSIAEVSAPSGCPVGLPPPPPVGGRCKAPTHLCNGTCVPQAVVCKG